MRRVRLARAGLALATALALLASGCGGDESDGIATAGGEVEDTGETELTDQERGLAFAACMRENGVDMPDPNPDSDRGEVSMPLGNADQQVLEAALEACRDLMPARPRLADLDPEQLEQMREFTACMRENGIDVPDPDPNGGGPRFGGSGISLNSPEFQDAMAACEDLLLGFGGGNS